MNISLKPHQLVAHWMPGFILLALVPVLKPDWYDTVKPILPADHISRGFIWVVLPFVAGQLIDCTRNFVFEAWADRWQRRRKQKDVNWKFFFSGDKDRIENLYRWFFEFYVFDMNLAFPAICFVICRLLQQHWVQALVGAALTYILYHDAWSLRREIAEHTNSS